ncbi:nitrate regulatory protein [Pectobacterium versatile]|uniref:Nitrate- and nitrite sensing domain-containing protein n=1 Tax=Pectobacterium versatile TaxID=2488639 RepID=A0A855MJ74_9GAMM|nr:MULTISPECIES: nitrate regulatory protein [Pectobacterium]MBA0182464.1 nitrate- and nitrite sensing domain-containing protein [Pectobacterium versatile]MCL6398488.1 ANTAR domain-containing protein [Pectobacterium carotovorum subsp. carotovorum]POY50629.1 nitrate-and nitrite-responsive positive regulator [Pectobacterium versatile]QPK14474.1 nitrate- and nitrite sensing domain-containing protein [Pectobacterium versatile]GBO48389.1 nitrate regulatory protein [Pectobacterium versatile]
MVAEPSTTIRFLLASRQCELNSLRYLLQSGELVGKISQLVHLLQRERGTANLFLCSDGRLFADELALREKDAQVAQTHLMTHLAGLEKMTAELPQASRLFSRVASVVYALSLLPALRLQIRQRLLPQPQAMTFFNDIVRNLLALVFEVSDTAADPGISRALIAMFSFMQGKELAGQERAIGAAAYAAGSVDEETRQKLLDLIERQDRCFDTFLSFSDEENQQRWRAITVDSEFERLRRIVCTRSPIEKLPEADSLHWFSIATRRIDEMKQMEDELEQTLMQRCRTRIAAAEKACSDQRADLDALMAQQEHDEPGYSIFIAGHDVEGQSAQPGWLHSDGVSPQLGRSLLSLVQQQSRRLQAQDHELAELRATLNERKQIDRAKGLLMQHRGLSEEEAYKTLRRMAMSQNKKLIDIATAMLAVADVFGDTP